MKMRNVAIIVLASAISAKSNAQWTAIDMHPPGAASSEIWAVSQNAEAGRITRPYYGEPAAWRGTPESCVSLSPSEDRFSGINGTTDTQQVGRLILPGYHSRAYLWSGTPESITSLHPSGYDDSEACGILGDKQVGWVIKSNNVRAVMWSGTAASMTSLHPSGAVNSRAYAMCATMQGGWISYSGWNAHAAIWRGTPESAVDLNPAGVTNSTVLSVSEESQAGTVGVVNAEQAACWQGTAASYANLQPPGCKGSRAYGVMAGVQAGYANFVYVGPRAALWTGSAGSFIDLGAILGPTYRSSFATCIWSDGSTVKVGGYGMRFNGQVHAIVWTGPMPNENFEFTLNKSAVAGQNYVQGTITMAQLRPNTVTYNVYDDSSLVTTPGNITIAAGALVRNFQISVLAVNSVIQTTIYAKKGNTLRSHPLTLTPLVPTAMAFTPPEVQGGQPTSCRVVINGVAGPNGRVMATFDNSTFATTPSTVTVPPGGTEVSFAITTLPVTAMKVVTVTARVSAGEKTGTFRIVP